MKVREQIVYPSRMTTINEFDSAIAIQHDIPTAKVVVDDANPVKLMDRRYESRQVVGQLGVGNSPKLLHTKPKDPIVILQRFLVQFDNR